MSKRDYLKYLGFAALPAIATKTPPPMNVNLNNTDNNDYVRGYKDGKKAGATEWVGKAEDLKEALEKVKNITSWMDGDDPHCQALRRIVEPALAKYKEVTNGDHT